MSDNAPLELGNKATRFDYYQEKAKLTAVYPNQGGNFIYTALGLAGEAGEVANKAKKIIRDNGGALTPEMSEDLQKELGDVLWYVAQCATELGVPLSHVALQNLSKLARRSASGMIRGSGDNRG